MRISDWISDVCSSDLRPPSCAIGSKSASGQLGRSKWIAESDFGHEAHLEASALDVAGAQLGKSLFCDAAFQRHKTDELQNVDLADLTAGEAGVFGQGAQDVARAQLVFFSAVYAKSNHSSEEHTSELQSLMRI